MITYSLAGVISLVGGSVPNEGDVHVDGIPISHYDWDLKDAWVLCKELGWAGVVAVKQSSFFGTRSRYYRYHRFNCNGKEDSILSCSKSEHYDLSYLASTAAGVICSTTSQGSTVTLQHVGNNTRSGLVHVNDRPVCEDGWDMVDASVICKELGYLHVKHIIGRSYGKSVELPFSMIDVECEGEEESLTACIHLQGNQTSSCNERNGAGVECSNIQKGILLLITSSVSTVS